jgi:uncharacterized membrane protein
VNERTKVMLKQKLVDITPGSVADFLTRLAVLVLLHFWLLNARDTITETGLQSMGEQQHIWYQVKHDFPDNLRNMKS